MSIVSRRNNYIFFHIPKCGGTSISEILPNKEKVRLIEHTHLSFKSTKLAFEENNEMSFFNECNKFAIVRNPFDRIASLYKYIKEHKDHHLYHRILNHDFTQFCYFLKNIGDENITSCYEHLSDINGHIDDSIKIFKLEEINDNIKEISDILGQKIEKIPHVNKSTFKYSLTEESDFLIREIYSDDLSFFYNDMR